MVPFSFWAPSVAVLNQIRLWEMPFCYIIFKEESVRTVKYGSAHVGIKRKDASMVFMKKIIRNGNY